MGPVIAVTSSAVAVFGPELALTVSPGLGEFSATVTVLRVHVY